MSAFKVPKRRKLYAISNECALSTKSILVVDLKYLNRVGSPEELSGTPKYKLRKGNSSRNTFSSRMKSSATQVASGSTVNIFIRIISNSYDLRRINLAVIPEFPFYVQLSAHAYTQPEPKPKMFKRYEVLPVRIPIQSQNSNRVGSTAAACKYSYRPCVCVCVSLSLPAPYSNCLPMHLPNQSLFHTHKHKPTPETERSLVTRRTRRTTTTPTLLTL